MKSSVVQQVAAILAGTDDTAEVNVWGTELRTAGAVAMDADGRELEKLPAEKS